MNLRLAFYQYWERLVVRLGFEAAAERPLITNAQNGPLYRLVFFARHALPLRAWSDAAKGHDNQMSLV